MLSLIKVIFHCPFYCYQLPLSIHSPQASRFPMSSHIQYISSRRRLWVSRWARERKARLKYNFLLTNWYGQLVVVSTPSEIDRLIPFSCGSMSVPSVVVSLPITPASYRSSSATLFVGNQTLLSWAIILIIVPPIDTFHWYICILLFPAQKSLSPAD